MLKPNVNSNNISIKTTSVTKDQDIKIGSDLLFLNIRYRTANIKIIYLKKPKDLFTLKISPTGFCIEKKELQKGFYFPYEKGGGYPFDFKWSRGSIKINDGKKKKIKINNYN